MAGNTTIPANPLHSPQSPSAPLVLSPEDKKIIQECNRDAFYQRCLPMAAGFAGLTYMAVKAGLKYLVILPSDPVLWYNYHWFQTSGVHFQVDVKLAEVLNSGSCAITYDHSAVSPGYLKGSATWGPTPKVAVALFSGYFLGKISYQQTCAEKLMANPNSTLGALLRARRQQGKGGFQDSLTLDMPGYSLPSLSDEKPRDMYQDDLSTRTFTDLDTDRPNTQSEDAYRYSFDSNPQRPEDFVLPPQSTQPNSYDEMRRMNREEFDKKQKTFYSSRPADEPPRYQPPRPSTSPDLLDPYGPTNAYGDVFEK